MIVFSGSTGNEPVAILLNNLILLPDGSLAALILGHCVFGKKGSVKGKYFNNTLYTLNGEVLGRSAERSLPMPANFADKKLEGWTIIERITDHSCPFIDPKHTWARQSVADVLLS